MKSHNRKRGEITIAVIAIVAVVGALAVWIGKPKKLDGESRRAQAGIEATAKLEAAHKAEIAAKDAQAATAAASVAQIGVAAGDVPPSPATDFIGREVTVAASLLPKPDALALLAAEQRRLAIMEGRLAQADALYRTAYADVAKLTERALQAERARDAAQDARAKADAAISEAAAANLALTRQSRLQWALFIGAVVLFGGGWIFTKVYGIDLTTAGKILTDIRAGSSPTQAFDTNLSPRLHKLVAKAAKLAA